MPVTGGSDYPFGGHIGDNRTYVFTGQGEPFSVDRWFEGIAQGRTFATQGPLIDFRVDGERPGAILPRKRGDVLTITADAAGQVDAGAPKNVSLVRFGSEVGHARSDDPGRTSLEGKWTIPVEGSCWLALRVGAHNNAEAHTSPVYVKVGDEPTWDRTQVEALVEKRLIWIRKFRETLARGPVEADAPDAVKGRFERVGEQLESWKAGREAFLARLDRCEKFYEELARKSRR